MVVALSASSHHLLHLYLKKNQIKSCFSKISSNFAATFWKGFTFYHPATDVMTDDDWLTVCLSVCLFFSLWSSLVEAPLPLLKTHIAATKQQPEGQKQKVVLIPGHLSQDKLRQLKKTFWQMKPVNLSQKKKDIFCMHCLLKPFRLETRKPWRKKQNWNPKNYLEIRIQIYKKKKLKHCKHPDSKKWNENEVIIIKMGKVFEGCNTVKGHKTKKY